MNWLARIIFGEEGQRSLVADLRSGRAGWGIRLGLSLAAAAVIIAIAVFGLGVIDVGGRVRDQHIATVFALGGVAWCGCLIWLWAAHRKWARVLRIGFALIAIWVITIPLCVVIDEMMSGNEELFISSLVILAIGLSIALISVSVYRNMGGKRVIERTGEVRVHCPECGYSLIGLETCTCPECGAKFTIDRLIAAQDYAQPERGTDVRDQPDPVHVDPSYSVPSSEY